MFQTRELSFFIKNNPEKVNADPWNPEKTIKCMELVEKYYDCVESVKQRNAVSMKSKCESIKKFALYCFKLERNYFLDAVSSEIDEESYLDLYLNKQMQRSTPKSVWKMKNQSPE